MDVGLRRHRTAGASREQIGQDSQDGPEDQAVVLRTSGALESRERGDRGETSVVVSPFCSEKAKVEALLAAARPTDLDAAASGQDSSSTELGACDVDEMREPAGLPRSFWSVARTGDSGRSR